MIKTLIWVIFIFKINLQLLHLKLTENSRIMRSIQIQELGPGHLLT